jgi:hypothetical protein
MHEAAQIISDVGLVYEAVLCHGVDSLFSASLILGVVSLPCCGHRAGDLRQVSRQGVWANSRPSVVYPAHPWVVCGQRFHPAAGNGAVFAVEYPVVQTFDVPLVEHSLRWWGGSILLHRAYMHDTPYLISAASPHLTVLSGVCLHYGPMTTRLDMTLTPDSEDEDDIRGSLSFAEEAR